MIYLVTHNLYRETAHRLCDVIGASNYFTGSLVFTADDVDCRLTASVIVYRRTVHAPDGMSCPIDDLIPVWWEFHTSDASGEISNDFSFNEMKTYLI